MLKPMVLPLLAATLVLAQTAPPKYEMRDYQFVFFMKGTGESKKEDAQKHLARLEDLWIKQGKAVLAGPVMDDGSLRGILVMQTTPEEARAFVDEDPFVKSGYMKAEIKTLFAADKILQKPPKFLDLTDYTLGFFRRPEGELPKLSDEEGNRLQGLHIANLGKMHDAGLLAWAGPFKDGKDLRGLIVFRSTDRNAIEKMLLEDPFVKLGRLVFELHPAKTSKGVFPEK